MKEKRIISILVIISLLVGITIKFPVRIRSSNTTLPKLSLISVSPIYIDDLDPNHNWDTFKARHFWVSGEGTPGDPYKLRRISIDASEGPYCITVRNSNKFFYIQDSVLFNTGETGAALKFYNVTLGFVIATEIYDNKFSGVEAVNSSIIFLSNRIHNNLGVGVYLEESKSCYMQYNRIWNNNGDGIELYNCSHIGIIDNDIFYNGMNGISLRYTDISYLEANKIYDNGHGIYLTNSSDNLIERNSIYSNKECGIHLVKESNRTHIEGNNIYENLHCISLGSSCTGTTGNNMENCEINYIDEDSPKNNNDYPNFFDLISHLDFNIPLIIAGIVIFPLCLIPLNYKRSNKKRER